MPPSSTDAAVLRIPALAAQPGLIHGFSTLAMGSMRTPAPGTGPLTPERRALAAQLGLDPERVTVAGAVHGAEVARVDEAVGAVRGRDALITDLPCLPLLATFADCYPVLVYDPVHRALALVHAGWRGTAMGVAARAVEALTREYGSDPAALLAGIGPGICARCYEVGDEVAERFDAAFLRPSPGRGHLLDLAAANRAQLEAAGVPAAGIHAHGECTRESARLPSHRRLPDGARFACIAAIA
ncbi:MAG TPA: polyphenol oxidase family protein [Candidatus Dormibacteraeota bacterium]|nr:polyphenol oxidase family protein [Candidatus Dormibacteraeota bacterium]